MPRTKIKTMSLVLSASMLLTLLKFAAYFITHSNALFTDALESVINVVAGSFALFSLYYASKPSDNDHPYGHGKIEFMSAGLEGGLIFLSGIAIIVKSVHAFFHPAPVNSVDIGAIMAAVAGFINYLMGNYLVKTGKKFNSLALKAEGKHLISDTYSSAGLVLGLIIIHFTQLYWLDNVLAVLFGFVILYTGFKLLKESVASLLDEADHDRVNHLLEILNRKRHNSWIDIHNVRLLKYGHRLHVDAHVTLPWYYNLQQSHNEVRRLENLIKNEFDGEIEFFIHSDPCLPDSCPICPLQMCPERKQNFRQKLTWTLANVLPDKKHSGADAD